MFAVVPREERTECLTQHSLVGLPEQEENDTVRHLAKFAPFSPPERQRKKKHNYKTVPAKSSYENAAQQESFTEPDTQRQPTPPDYRKPHSSSQSTALLAASGPPHYCQRHYRSRLRAACLEDIKDAADENNLSSTSTPTP